MRFGKNNGFNSYEEDDDDERGDEQAQAFAEAEAEMMADAFARSDEARHMEMKLVDKQVRAEVLDKAIFVAKSSWFWGLFSSQSRLDSIKAAYHTLSDLIK